jgi:hypothetical protein
LTTPGFFATFMSVEEEPRLVPTDSPTEEENAAD